MYALPVAAGGSGPSARPLWLLGLATTFSLDTHYISQHKHIIGLTGQGKSVLVANLFSQLIEQGIASSLIDPHSDLADDVLSMLSRRGLLANVYHIDFGRTGCVPAVQHPAAALRAGSRSTSPRTSSTPSNARGRPWRGAQRRTSRTCFLVRHRWS